MQNSKYFNQSRPYLLGLANDIDSLLETATLLDVSE